MSYQRCPSRARIFACRAMGSVGNLMCPEQQLARKFEHQLSVDSALPGCLFVFR